MNQRKTNRHQKVTYGLLLLEHIPRAPNDTVTQRAHWLQCLALLSFSFFKLFAKHNIIFFCIVTSSSENRLPVVFASTGSQGQPEDEFSKTLLFMHVGR